MAWTRKEHVTYLSLIWEEVRFLLAVLTKAGTFDVSLLKIEEGIFEVTLSVRWFTLLRLEEPLVILIWEEKTLILDL
jgi:hypothetical protein